ncbi:MAG: glucosamine-6-phosphate deaminase [Marivirga sp.]|nr:glucosamine-6-phosphate deaminase [Marivirga sp.]
MKVNTYPDYKTLSRATADLITEYISKKKNSLVCLASGHSPRGVFECLIADVKSKRLDITGCVFVSLDEWIGIAAKQKGSCRDMMDEDFFEPLQIPENHIKFFDGISSDLAGEVSRMDEFILARGGLDIMLVGVGTNGHIAMNEPGTSFDSMAHLSTLADETKTVGQKYFSESTELNEGITLGLRHFRESKLPILIANGIKKTEIVRKILSSTPTEVLPASVIHLIDQGYVMLDKEAAS